MNATRNKLYKYIYFHSLYTWRYQCVKFKENPCVGMNESTPFIDQDVSCSPTSSMTQKMLMKQVS